jgi:cell wall-associated NlpC family hydrolase
MEEYLDKLTKLLYKTQNMILIIEQIGGKMVRRAGLLLLALLLSIPTAAFAAKTHKVKKNETLASLAKKYHVPLNDLKEANNLLNSNVNPGDILVVPPRGSSKSAVSVSTKDSTAAYKVKKGDTIARVSKKTGVSVVELKRLNGLAKGKLKPGQILALYDNDAEVKPVKRTDVKPSLRYADLLSEKEYEQSLADLLDQDSVNLHAQKAPDFKSDSVKLLKTKAFGFLGTRYRFGGSSRNGLDCSAFVQKVFNEMEVSLPRTAREQFERGEIVTRGDMQKGDLVFFRTYASFPSHVGIYLGGNRMIHASSRDRRVVISSVDTPYYRARFIGAKRISKIAPDRFNLDELMLGVEEETPDDAQKNDLLGVDTANLP